MRLCVVKYCRWGCCCYFAELLAWYKANVAHLSDIHFFFYYIDLSQLLLLVVFFFFFSFLLKLHIFYALIGQFHLLNTESNRNTVSDSIIIWQNMYIYAWLKPPKVCQRAKMPITNHVTPIVKSFKIIDVLIIIDILGVQIFL